MADATTIKLSRDTKALLEDKQIDGETFNQTVRRLAGDTTGKAWTEQEIRDLIQQEIQTVQNY